jgi:nucleotide-binding universal stress UspA family protein
LETFEGGADALIQPAGSEDADLIVVGRRGLGGFTELVLGSFSHQTGAPRALADRRRPA